MIQTIRLLITLSGLINSIIELVIAQRDKQQSEELRAAIQDAKQATTREEKQRAAQKLSALIRAYRS